MLITEETFFTIIGCMDGRVQEPLAKFGREKFQAFYPDTITEAGQVGIIANDVPDDFRHNLKNKIDISVVKHKSKGILIAGHADCAGNLVEDDKQKKDVINSVKIIKEMVGPFVPVVGAFVSKIDNAWVVEEI